MYGLNRWRYKKDLLNKKGDHVTMTARPENTNAGLLTPSKANYAPILLALVFSYNKKGNDNAK
jgi:hypothetical protein